MLRKGDSRPPGQACQPRAMSLVEALANVVVGYGVAVVTQLVVFPLVGLTVALSDSLIIGAVFTVVSIARSYLLRRLFEAVRMQGPERGTAALWRAAAMLGLWAGQLPMR